MPRDSRKRFTTQSQSLKLCCFWASCTSCSAISALILASFFLCSDSMRRNVSSFSTASTATSDWSSTFLASSASTSCSTVTLLLTSTTRRMPMKQVMMSAAAMSEAVEPCRRRSAMVGAPLGTLVPNEQEGDQRGHHEAMRGRDEREHESAHVRALLLEHHQVVGKPNRSPEEAERGSHGCALLGAILLSRKREPHAELARPGREERNGPLCGKRGEKGKDDGNHEH